MTGTLQTPGARVGPYEVVAFLGGGGMGQVYRARDTRLARDVALKVVRSDGATDKDALRRFADEARAASLLSHPSIVAVYDVGDLEGRPYIVSELLQGETLRDRLAAGAMPLRKAIEHGVQILHGLAAAHDKGIVHRDLKPENLFLTKDGLVKILDFGIAKLRRPDEDRAETGADTKSFTTPGAMLGTAGYMSPEQARGLAVDHRSDLFSFGAVLYEMLTGRRAFAGATMADTLSAILREDPTEAPETASTLPPDLLRVVRRALEKAPEDRFQTARDMAFALEGAATSPREVVPGATRRLIGSRLLAAVALTAAGVALWWVGHTTAPAVAPPSFQRITFRSGQVDTARFAPDGETILYSAKWGTEPVELFSTRANATAGRSLNVPNALLEAVSPREELALLLSPRIFAPGSYEGTLARVPMSGGPPREILEGVVGADWSPDGKDLAVVHVVGERYQLEYPIGHVLYAPDPPIWLSNVRISPAGGWIAFQEHPFARDNGGDIAAVDREGRKRTLASAFGDLAGLAWSTSGAEVWFAGAGAGHGIPQRIVGASLSGQQRVITEALSNLEILDVSRRGVVLVTSLFGGTEVHARARGAEETQLFAGDYSFLSDLSDDGRFVLGTDSGEGGGATLSFYIQGTDGTPPLWLGEGDGQQLSPDSRFALAILARSEPQRLVIVPVGAGEPRMLDPGPIRRYVRAVWDRTGRRVFASGLDKGDALRVYVQDVGGGTPTAVTPEDVGLGRIGRPVSPDGQRIVAVGPDDVAAVYPLAGGEPMAIPGLGRLDVPLSWTPDGRALMVAHYEENEDAIPRVERVEVTSGRRQRWSRARRTAPGGLQSTRILVSPDGESYAYSYLHNQADLFVSSPIR